jgi:hypothetical protein
MVYGVGIEALPLKGLSLFGCATGAGVKKEGAVGGGADVLLLEEESVVMVGLVLD